MNSNSTADRQVSSTTSISDAPVPIGRRASFIREPQLSGLKHNRLQGVTSTNALRTSLLLTCFTLATGCASTYGNLVSGSKLGANEYQPAVLAQTPESQAKYEQILPVCRQVAVNRQITSAQEAQLKSITGVAEGTGEGLAAGLEFGGMLKSVGLPGASLDRSMAIGAAAGLVSSLVSAFADGAEQSAAETKQILIRCLKTAAPAAGYQVLEDG